MNWHEPTCRRPDIHVLDGVPFCMRCATDAPLEDIQDAEALGVPTLPAPPPRWNSALTWPRSVEYTENRSLGSGGMPDDFGSQLVDIVKSQCMADSLRNTESSIDHEAECQSQLTSHGAPAPESEFSETATILTQTASTDAAYGGEDDSHLDTLIISLQLIDGDRIRLFKLSRGEPGDPVHGTLHVANLADRPSFEALSYTWADDTGNAARSKKIFLGDHWHIGLVTANCKAALERMRLTDEDRMLWVDQICINQERQNERTNHVNIIRDIYATAASVLVYLGDGTPSKTFTLAMDLISRAHEGTRMDQTSRDALDALFGRPYFSRVWVIQELAMARSAIVHCGRSRLGWSLFREDRLRQLGILDRVPRWILDFDRPRYRGAEDFSQLLISTRTAHSADPRDKIFALLGLMHGAEFDGLVPDYGLSKEETYVGAASFAMLKNGRVDLLRFSTGATSWPVLPSWVPDWTSVPPDTSSWVGTLEEIFDQGLRKTFFSRPGRDEFEIPRLHEPSREKLYQSHRQMHKLVPLTASHNEPTEPQHRPLQVHHETGSLFISTARVIDLCEFKLLSEEGSRPLVYKRTLMNGIDIFIATNHTILDDSLYVFGGCDQLFQMRCVRPSNDNNPPALRIMGVCKVAVFAKVSITSDYNRNVRFSRDELMDLVSFGEKEWRDLVLLEHSIAEQCPSTVRPVDITPFEILSGDAAVATAPLVYQEYLKQLASGKSAVAMNLSLTTQATNPNFKDLHEAIMRRLRFWDSQEAWRSFESYFPVQHALEVWKSYEATVERARRKIDRDRARRWDQEQLAESVNLSNAVSQDAQLTERGRQHSVRAIAIPLPQPSTGEGADEGGEKERQVAMERLREITLKWREATKILLHLIQRHPERVCGDNPTLESTSADTLETDDKTPMDVDVETDTACSDATLVSQVDKSLVRREVKLDVETSELDATVDASFKLVLDILDERDDGQWFDHLLPIWGWGSWDEKYKNWLKISAAAERVKGRCRARKLWLQMQPQGREWDTVVII